MYQQDIYSTRRSFLKNMLQVFVLSFLSLKTSISWAGNAVAIQHFRFHRHKEYTRVVFETEAPIKHELTLLQRPERLILDFKNTYFKNIQQHQTLQDAILQTFRSGIRNENDLRVVFDLKTQVEPKVFWLDPDKEHNNYRFVMDLYDKKSINNQKDKIVVIDPGHGGKDPGAIGPNGTMEKTIVLAIAKKLAHLINKQQGMKAYLTRSQDEYIDLRQRVEFAREKNADLFISLHADAVANHTAKGASVYVLSLKGASSEAARLLAAKENAVDVIGGVINGVQDNMVASVLLDLSQTATIQESEKCANLVLEQLDTIGTVHKENVQHAGFMVLKAPDIPSVLVETAFISNHEEEQKLKDEVYQQKIALGVLEGVDKFFQKDSVLV